MLTPTRRIPGRRNPRGLLLVLVCALPAILSACRRSEAPVSISLPPTSVLSTRSSWAVVEENLLRVRETPSKDGELVYHIPRGNIVEIISRTGTMEEVEGVQGYWYLIDSSGLKGWVFGGYLQMAATRSEAEKLAAALAPTSAE